MMKSIRSYKLTFFVLCEPKFVHCYLLINQWVCFFVIKEYFILDILLFCEVILSFVLCGIAVLAAIRLC